MKFNRGVALGTSLVLILAACGDSSSSSRDRNASFAGTECYTKDEFPALKVQATAMSNTYVATAKEVEVAKELATTDLLAWKKSEEESSELIALRKALKDAQAKYDNDSKRATDSTQSYINLLNNVVQFLDPNLSDATNAEIGLSVSNQNFTKNYWQSEAAKSEALLKEAAGELLRALNLWASEVKAKLQTSEESTDAYNALIQKYDEQVAEYRKFTSIKACPVLLSAGDAEGPAPSSTTSTTRPTFQFEETPASPSVTIEGSETDSTISSTNETTPSSSSTTSTTSSTVASSSSSSSSSSTSTSVPPKTLGDVIIIGKPIVIRPFETLDPPTPVNTVTSSTSTSTSTSSTTTFPIPTVVIETSAVQAFFSNPVSGLLAGGVVVPDSYTTPSGEIVVIGGSFLTFPALSSPNSPGPISSEIAPNVLVGPFGAASFYGGGFYAGSEMHLHGTVSKQSLGRLRADKAGNVVGSLKVPEGTQSGPFKLVAFGFNAKKQPVVLPLTINLEVPKTVATTSTSVVVDTSIASVDSTVVATETGPSDDSTGTNIFGYWWALLLILVLILSIFRFKSYKKVDHESSVTDK